MAVEKINFEKDDFDVLEATSSLTSLLKTSDGNIIY